MLAIVHLKIAFDIRQTHESDEEYAAIQAALTPRIRAHKEELELILEQFWQKRIPEIAWRTNLDSDPTQNLPPDAEAETI